MASIYRVRPLSAAAEAGFGRPDQADWAAPVWESAEVAKLGWFHPQSSEHHPATQVRLLHDEQNIYVRFDVQDRYVIAAATEFQQMVCLDSCVEFFFQPQAGGGYFNLEINCGGTMLMWFVEDYHRTEKGLAKWTAVRCEDARKMRIYHSMPKAVLPERQDPVAWRIGCTIPLETLQPYVAVTAPLGGQTWRGNFYKCADHSSHPHWGSWSPMGEALNFHQPEFFGTIVFDR